MKKLVTTACVILSLAVFAEEKPAPTAPAPTSDPKAAPAPLEEKDDSFGSLWVEAVLDIKSDYMWRGVILNDNPCWQPSVSIGYNTEDYGGLYFNYWASHDLTHKRNRMPYGNNSRMSCGLQEIDYYLGYTKDIGDFSFEVGYYWYTYPNSGKHTNHNAGNLGQDLYFGVFYNNDYITPGAEVFWAPSAAHGHDPSICYFRFSAKHAFKFFDDKLTVTPKTALGMGDHAFTQANIAMYRKDSRDNYGTELTDHTTTLDVSYDVCEHFSIGGSVNYTWVPSRSLRHERWMTGGHDNRNALCWLGVCAKVSF